MRDTKYKCDSCTITIPEWMVRYVVKRESTDGPCLVVYDVCGECANQMFADMEGETK